MVQDGLLIGVGADRLAQRDCPFRQKRGYTQGFMVMTFKQERFNTAAEFLDAVQPRSPRWGTRPERWLFRGHGDARWHLLPSAFRKEAWEKFGGFDPNVDDAIRADRETRLLRWFAEHLNEAGLSVPGFSLDDLRRVGPGPRQWPETFRELAALAQHHGLPTRLLDFTRNPYVAAYFATHEPPGPAEYLAVWAIDSQWIMTRDDDDDGPWLSVEHALRASNPNLHAQSGVFITWTGDGPAPVRLETLLATINRSGRARPPDETPARLLVLPRTEANELLGLLAREQVNAARLFPGVDGVVKQIRDQARLSEPW